MVERTIIFGNGLGRAIDNDFFSLEAALRCAWEEDDLLTSRQKKLILACLPLDVIDDDVAPTSEDELEDLQRIVSACDEIAKMEHRVEAQGAGWLSPLGAEFPTAIRTYLHRAARYFLDRDALVQSELPAEFARSLRQHIMGKGANVVTLNYDDLLYECFADTEVFQQHRLRDGFFKGGFDIDSHRKFIAMDPGREGWFLHLHGSPLFLTRQGAPRKLTRHELRQYGGIDSTHLVLTNVKYKASVIETSEILREYWRCFSDCCAATKDMLLIGYGGYDLHLNRAISGLSANCTIRIVQRKVKGRELEDLEEDLETEWSSRFGGRKVEVQIEDNILDFRSF